jgi:hypothetical protein
MAESDRYASIGTSEAPAERLLSEQKDIQGPHGVNFGIEKLHARLVGRHISIGHPGNNLRYRFWLR